jgi:hypothetical protein
LRDGDTRSDSNTEWTPRFTDSHAQSLPKTTPPSDLHYAGPWGQRPDNLNIVVETLAEVHAAPDSVNQPGKQTGRARREEGQSFGDLADQAEEIDEVIAEMPCRLREV